MRYNPALDGVRAAAVVFVMAFHISHPIFQGGKVGVDMFFVLSGYLITSILLNELRETGSISLTDFYTRRALRLLPALGVLAAFQIVRSMFSSDGTEIREATLIGTAYLENWNAIYHFGPDGVMGHTWSLATEEQFYLLWPLLLPLVVKKRPLMWLSGAFFAMMIARVLFWEGGRSLTALSYSPFLRPVGLLIGCILAVLPIERWRLPKIALPTLLLPLVAILFSADKGATTLISSLATGGLIVYFQGARATDSVFAASPVRYIGRISYGLYLYHYPAFILTEKWKAYIPPPFYEIGLIVLIFIVATLSYELIEKPILGVRGRFKRDSATSAVRWLRSSEQFPRFDKCHSTGFEGCGNFMRRPRRVAG
jgi:peptidoglycan/LPS O-acetylase OafA/YrhL